MLGLIKKDLLILKSNFKIALAIIISFIFVAFQGNGKNAMLMLPIIGIIMFISTFSYDEFNHWNAYAISLPNGRKNVIRAKYISSIILLTIISIISVVFTLIISKIENTEISIYDIIPNFLGMILSTSLLISLLYPFMIKYGAMNGRIVIFVFIMGIGAIGYIVSKFVNMNNILQEIDSLTNETGGFITVAISIILLIISYFISNKIYQNKEF